MPYTMQRYSQAEVIDLLRRWIEASGHRVKAVQPIITGPHGESLGAFFLEFDDWRLSEDYPIPGQGHARPLVPVPIVSVSVATISDWLARAKEALEGEPTDWDSALRSLVESMESAIGAAT